MALDARHVVIAVLIRWYAVTAICRAVNGCVSQDVRGQMGMGMPPLILA